MTGLKNIYPFFIVLFIILNSCKSTKSSNYSVTSSLSPKEIIEQIKRESKEDKIKPDYSQSAENAIKLIKANILSDNIPEFIVEIESVHNGKYTSKSKFNKQEHKVKIITENCNVNGEISTSEHFYTINELLTELEELILSANDQIVIAGTYQRIVIVDKFQKSEFYTRKALGLLDLMN